MSWLWGGGAFGLASALAATLWWAGLPFESTALVRLRPPVVPERFAPTGELDLKSSLQRIQTSLLVAEFLSNAIGSVGLYPEQTAGGRPRAAVERMRADLQVEAVKSDALRIRFRYDDRKLAQQAVAHLADRAMREFGRVRGNQTAITVELLAHRRRSVGQAWEAAVQAGRQPGASGRAALDATIARQSYETISRQLLEAQIAAKLEDRQQGPVLELLEQATLPDDYRPDTVWEIGAFTLPGGLVGMLSGWLFRRLALRRKLTPWRQQALTIPG